MRGAVLIALILAGSAAGCSRSGAFDPSATADRGAVSTPPRTPTHTASMAQPAMTATARPAPCKDYRADLEDGDMAMIYQAAAGLTPPFDRWADAVLARSPRDADPEAAWTRAKAQVQAQWNAVSPIRCVALRTRAAIRPYDAARGGLIVESLAPDHHFTFGNDLRMSLRNAQSASVWKMPAERAEALYRGSNQFNGADLVVRLHILGARPRGSGGMLEADVDGFDIVPGAYGNVQPATVSVEPS
jgi:hypothetical protein